MMSETYWWHRLSNHEPHISNPLFRRHNLLNIGFSQFAANPEYARSRRKKDVYDGHRDTYRAPNKPARILWNFMHEMKVGDYVLTPSKPGDRDFDVCMLISDHALTVSDFADLEISRWKTDKGKPIARTADGRYIKLSENPDNQFIDLGFFRRVKIVGRDLSWNHLEGTSLKTYPQTNKIIQSARELEVVRRIVQNLG